MIDITERMCTAAKSKPFNFKGLENGIKQMKETLGDYQLLEEFINSNAITVDGRKIEAIYEDSSILGGESIPVIRLEHKKTVLTRIFPNRPETSVLVRIRPGWENIKEELAKNFKAYVCSHADEPYVKEIWRILDPSRIFFVDYNSCITVVPKTKHKSLDDVLVKGGDNPKFAVIIDDSPEAWRVEDRDQICPVKPYDAYAPVISEMYDPQISLFSPLPKKLLWVQETHSSRSFLVDLEMKIMTFPR